MIIKKFLHSCILLEDNGGRLLIDPGAWSFIENKITPKDIGPVDAILLTHNHNDHCSIEAVKGIIGMKLATIIADEQTCTMLKEAGIAAEPIKAGETRTVAGFTIQAIEAQHEPIPSQIPHNLGFLINNALYHPGDSLVPVINHCGLLFLPIAGPPVRLSDALAFAKKLKPKKVIPIHDVILKDFALDRIYTIVQTKLKEAGIEFYPLKLGEKLEV